MTYRGNSLGRARRRHPARRAAGRSASRVDVVLLEQGALVQRMLKGDFESIMFVFNATNLDPAMNPDFWLSSGSAHIWNIGQPKPATDWEKEIDDLMGTVMTQRRSGRAQAGVRRRCRRSSPSNLPVLYFVAPRLYMGVSTRVGGLTPSILRPQLLWNVDRMTVKPAPVSRVMGRYLLRRLGFALLLVFVVSSAALLLTRIAPGDFATDAGPRPDRRAARAAARRARARSVARRRSICRGSAAPCDSTSAARCCIRGPVSTLVSERALNTAVLATVALLLATADRHSARHLFRHATRGAGRSIVRALSVLGLSVPPLIGSLALVFLAARTGWFPVGGMTSSAGIELTWAQWLADLARHLPLPALALAHSAGRDARAPAVASHRRRIARARSSPPAARAASIARGRSCVTRGRCRCARCSASTA